MLNKAIQVFAQPVRVTLLAARFAIYFPIMVAKLKEDTDKSTYMYFNFAYFEMIQQLKHILQ